jgi:hypothetical protein
MRKIPVALRPHPLPVLPRPRPILVQPPSLADRLDTAKRALGPVLDQINQGFAEAEKRLRALQPVEGVWFRYRSEPADPNAPVGVDYCINYLIGIAKHDGEWRLCWGTTHDGFPEMDVAGIQPVSELSRWERVDLAALLPEWFPDLQERIVKETEGFLPKAKNALAKMMAELGQE